MKKVSFLIIAACFTCATIFAQNDSLFRASELMRMDSPSKRTVQFSGMDLNIVTEQLNLFMSEKMEMSQVGEGDFVFAGEKITFTVNFVSMVSTSNSTAAKLNFKFNLVPQSHYFHIKDCVISGKWETVALFYINYWPNSLVFDEMKGKSVVYTNFYADVAEFVSNLSQGTAKVIVKKRI